MDDDYKAGGLGLATAVSLPGLLLPPGVLRCNSTSSAPDSAAAAAGGGGAPARVLTFKEGGPDQPASKQYIYSHIRKGSFSSVLDGWVPGQLPGGDGWASGGVLAGWVAGRLAGTQYAVLHASPHSPRAFLQAGVAGWNASPTMMHACSWFLKHTHACISACVRACVRVCVCACMHACMCMHALRLVKGYACKLPLASEPHLPSTRAQPPTPLAHEAARWCSTLRAQPPMPLPHEPPGWCSTRRVPAAGRRQTCSTNNNNAVHNTAKQHDAARCMRANTQFPKRWACVRACVRVCICACVCACVCGSRPLWIPSTQAIS